MYNQKFIKELIYKSTYTYAILHINSTIINHGITKVDREEKVYEDMKMTANESFIIYQVLCYYDYFKKIMGKC